MTLPTAPSTLNVVIPDGIEKREGRQDVVGCYLRHLTFGKPELGDDNYVFDHFKRAEMIDDNQIQTTKDTPLTSEQIRLSREVMGIKISEEEEGKITIEFAAKRYWTFRKETEEEKARVERAKQYANTKPFIN